MELKDIIKLRRKELNLNLLDIAKACNVSEATVSRWESGNIGQIVLQHYQKSLIFHRLSS